MFYEDYIKIKIKIVKIATLIYFVQDILVY